MLDRLTRSRRLRLALAGLAAALLLAGAAAWRFAGRGDAHGQERLHAVQDELDRVRAPYLLVLGDSHVELLALTELCGMPVVTAGWGGATLPVLAAYWSRLALSHPPARIVLQVGTNDVNAKRRPDEAASLAGFEAQAGRLLAQLRDAAPALVVAAIPPVAASAAASFPPEAAARHDAILQRLCTRPGCRFLDLHAAIRAPDGLAPADAFTDGVHLRDHARYYREREREVCGAER